MNKEDDHSESGFEDDEKYPHCFSAGHNPPNFMVIPYGKRYRHVCPSCKQVSYIRASNIV